MVSDGALVSYELISIPRYRRNFSGSKRGSQTPSSLATLSSLPLAPAPPAL